jgi:hypothetical protein
MQEAFLHFVWQYKLFDTENLKSTFGESIEIIKTGLLNTNQGPDFFNAQLKINGQTLIGNIEIHLRNEDWYKHQHQTDDRYNNTILHVVFNPTDEIYTLTKNNQKISILALKDYIQEDKIAYYEHLFSSKEPIPCQKIYKLPQKIKINHFYEKLAIERLERKSEWMYELLKKNNNHFETTFYQVLLYSFGLKINAPFFLHIAESLPQKVLARHIDDLFQLEALLLGQANLLNSENEYAQKLKTEYSYLQKKYQLTPIPAPPLFSKLYPASFPTLRLAQFAAFIHNKTGLYAKITASISQNELLDLFQIAISDFWKTHYHFDTKTEKTQWNIAPAFVQKIIINVLIPFMYLNAKMENKNALTAIEGLEKLKPENNKITRIMTEALGLQNQNAYHSQALIEWNQSYCQQKNCLACCIGHEIFC